MPILNWIGKEAVVNHDKDVPFRLLKKVKSLSYGENSQNLIIHGDNLEALKALMPYYQGQVKCIYIDPPYNTGNEGWVYNDKVNSPKIKKWLGKVVGSESEDLCRHDKWLCMMYPRLKLLRDLLSDDGVIFVSIDDNELVSLRSIMDDLFNEQNRVDRGILIWNNAGSTRGFRRIVKNHEYILAYGKNQELVESVYAKNFPTISDTIDERLQIKRTNRNPLAKVTFPKGLKIEGVSDIIFRDSVGRGTNRIDIINGTMEFKNGKLVKDVLLEASFPYKNQMIEFFSKLGTSEKTYDYKGQEWLEVYFRKNGVPYFRKKRGTVVLGSVINNCANSGSPDLEKLGMKNVFSNPKPVELIKRLLAFFTDKNALILDSFAGSGTTGQAVLDLNKEDGGNRKFILIEIGEKLKEPIKLDDGTILANTEQITTERVKRAINKYDYKTGFEYCELDKPLFNEDGQIEQECTFEQLATYIYFTETNTNIDKKEISGNFIGDYDETEYYLIFKEKGKNILSKGFLEKLKKDNKKKVIYADKCLIDERTLEKYKIQFKQIPYEVKVY
ncbi:site-specific DNA-methyltransferase [Fervidicoccus sp.]|uniref:site-specific DNA-methyltransferase n=1 Tax=Fervidicoccus sp. TaxID=2060324 RepID=UPI003D0D60F9